MGLYSTCQFLGVAFGGILGGCFFQLNGAFLVFMAGLILCACWFIISLNMRQPAYTCSIRSILPRYIKDFNLLQIQLMNEPGVREVMFDHNALSAYIKIDKKIISRHKLETIINNQ